MPRPTAMAAKDTDTQMNDFPRVPLPDYRERRLDEMRARLADFHADVQRRRTVRDFPEKPVPRDLIEGALAAAGTVPSGANLQPWHFAVVSGPETKRRIRTGTGPRRSACAASSSAPAACAVGSR